jgi:hypothetical protein
LNDIPPTATLSRPGDESSAERPSGFRTHARSGRVWSRAVGSSR